ncbi:MAG TPA: F0F1 ATP synthase subunit B [Candidatus Paceibacterota bacterium]|nr:F0F1 ATP synthase subunit B [Candidatus Paceibacterota bacterium]
MSALFQAFGIDWHLLLIQAVNFGLLLAALTYFLYKPVLRIIDERREKIAESVRVANAAAKKLEDAKTKSDSMVGAATKEAEELVAVARTRADEKANELLKAAQSRSDALLAEAAAKAEEAKRQAVRASEKEIARAAMLAAEKILSEKAA